MLIPAVVLKPVSAGGARELAALARGAGELTDGSAVVVGSADDAVLLSEISHGDDLARVLSSRSDVVAVPLAPRGAAGDAHALDGADVLVATPVPGRAVRTASGPGVRGGGATVHEASLVRAGRRPARAARAAAAEAANPSLVTRGYNAVKWVVSRPVVWVRDAATGIVRGARLVLSRGVRGVEDVLAAVRAKAGQAAARASEATTNVAARAKSWLNDRQQQFLDLWRRQSRRSEERARVTREREESEAQFRRRLEQHRDERRSLQRRQVEVTRQRQQVDAQAVRHQQEQRDFDAFLARLSQVREAWGLA